VRMGATPGRAPPRTAAPTAVMSTARPLPGDGVSRAASIAGPPLSQRRGLTVIPAGRRAARVAPAGGRWLSLRRGLTVIPAAGGVARPGTTARRARGSGRAAWLRPATRRETVICPRRPARGSSRPARRPVFPAPGRGSSPPLGCAGGGTGRKPRPVRPQRTANGQRRTGPRRRPAGTGRVPGRDPRRGVSRRRLIAGATGGPGWPRAPASGRPAGPITAVRTRPSSQASGQPRPLAAPGRAETTTSGPSRSPPLGPPTVPPRARGWIIRRPGDGRPWMWCPPGRPRRLSAAGWPRTPRPGSGLGLSRPRADRPAVTGWPIPLPAIRP